MPEALTIETIDYDAFEKSPKKESIVALSIKGSIRKNILDKMIDHKEPFPVKNHITQASIKFYILNRQEKDPLKRQEWDSKTPLLLFTRSVHRKEIARIRKAFITIERNAENELISKEGVDMKKVCRLIQIMWMQDEFYISKEPIRRYLNALSVFYKSCGNRKGKKRSISHAKRENRSQSNS